MNSIHSPLAIDFADALLVAGSEQIDVIRSVGTKVIYSVLQAALIMFNQRTIGI